MEGNCFDAYLSLCTRFRLAPPWDCVPRDPQAFSGPSDPTAALAALLADYPERTLIEAGIAQPNATGRLEIHPFLSIPGAPIVSLCDTSFGRVNNLMTEAGCVRGFRYPLFAVLLDKHSYWAIEGTWRELILTDSLEDAIVLRSLGFAAAPVVGLADLDDYGLKLLGSYFGVKRSPSDHGRDDKCKPQPRTADEQAAAQRIYARPGLWSLPGCNKSKDAENFLTMTLANWSPKALSLVEPPAIRSAVRYLQDLKSFQNLDLFEVNLWSPTTHQMASMKFALARREAGWAKSAVFDTLDLNNRSLALIPENKPPIDLATAVEEMQHAFLNDSGDAGSRKRYKVALATYQSVVQRDLLGPLTRQTKAIADPFERAMHAQWADLYAVFAEKMLGMRERMYADLKANPQNCKSDDKNDVTVLLSISKQMLLLTNHILRCTRKKTSPKPTKHTTSSGSRRFGGLDLPMLN
jgi:hypothetical protein